MPIGTCLPKLLLLPILIVICVQFTGQRQPTSNTGNLNLHIPVFRMKHRFMILAVQLSCVMLISNRLFMMKLVMKEILRNAGVVKVAKKCFIWFGRESLLELMSPMVNHIYSKMRKTPSIGQKGAFIKAQVGNALLF